MDQPLVSVILPVKNGERYLAEAIRSVLGQDYPAFELLVVDGQSTDRTAEIARSFPVRYFFQESDPSLAAARNLGIAAARGELIAFISHDDLWEGNKLTLQVDYLVSHPEVQYTFAHVRFFLEPGCTLPAGFRRQLLEGDYPGPMPETLLARRSLFEEIGGFSSLFPLGEDVDWVVRSRDLRVKSATIPNVLVSKRIHEGNLSFKSSSRRVLDQDMLKIAKQSLDRKRAGANRDGNE